MNRSLRLCSMSILLIGFLTACNRPDQRSVAPTLDQQAIELAVQQTVAAAAVATANAAAQAPAQPPTQPSVNAPANPPPAETATLAPSPTISLTPTITITPTPAVPMVSVSVDTNCRVGPGKIYKLVGALLVGEQTEVVARDPSGQYWYVRNPDRPGEFCWLWGQYATTSGNTGSLPVFTPPPTPTFTPSPTPNPSFAVSFREVDACVGWFVEFTITNNGGVMFQSLSVTVTDNDTAETVSANYEKFEDWNGCLTAGAYEDLDPGDTGYTTSAPLTADPTGHSVSATLTLCSEPALGGTCFTKSLTFTP